MAAVLCAGDRNLFADMGQINQSRIANTRVTANIQMHQAGISAPPIVIAHNADSIAEVKTAVKHGADMVEADVWYLDQRLVVAHTLGVGDLLNLPVDANALGRHIDFGDWLDAVPNQTAIMVDVKGGGQRTAVAVSEALSLSGVSRSAVLCSRVWSHVQAAQAQINLVGMYSIGVSSEWDEVIPLLASAKSPAISISKEALSTEIAAMAGGLGAIIYAWTINTRAEAVVMAKLGVSGIVTDNVPEIVGTLSN